MSKSNYLEESILNHIFRGSAFAAVGTVYVALFTADPGEAGGGTEVSGGAYARASVTSGAGAWSDPTGTGQISNSSDIVFPTPSGGNWGVCTHFAIFDAASGGNMLYHNALSTSKTINDGDSAPSFATGTLQISED